MEVAFADDSLAKLEGNEAGETHYPVAVIKSARRKLAVIRAAPDDQMLQRWKSLHYEKLKGDREGQRSVRLNDQYRLVFVIDPQEPPTATILTIEDYH